MLLLENISLKFDSELIIDKFNLDIAEESIFVFGDQAVAVKPLS